MDDGNPTATGNAARNDEITVSAVVEAENWVKELRKRLRLDEGRQ